MNGASIMRNHLTSCHQLANTCLLKKSLKSILICLALSMYHTGSYADKVYKWVDENGKVNYGSSKPADADAERMKIHIRPAIPPEEEPPAGEGDQNSKNKDGKDADKKDDKKAKKEAKKKLEKPKLSRAEQQRLCKQARDNLSTIQSRGQLRERDSNGEVRYVSDKERQGRLSAARKNINKYCR